MVEMMKKIFMSSVALLCTLVALSQSRVTQEHIDRAAQIVSQMTLEEKVAYVGGYESWYIRSIERLGLPAIRMADGPQGVRNNTRSTLYPSGIAAAATWDRDLIHKMGIALGQDSRARGVHILLGPGVNIYRSPLCGRNFEYFGEDPFLTGEIAAAYITGLQSQGVMASVKHFAANNQEWGRHHVSSDVDERTLHEIYFPAFEKAVKKADVGTVMTSYNLLNSVHASESKYLNYDVLRDMWGYKGLVMSDWTSCYSPLNVATWGVDIEMPSPKCMTPQALLELVRSGRLDEGALDRKCQHIIQTVLSFGFDKREQLDKSIPENNPYSDSIALEIARGAVVMLKNEGGFLPFRKGDFFICGPNADKVVTGGGSGHVTPLISSSVAKGMSEMGRNVKSFLMPDKILKKLDGMYSDRDMTVPGVKVQMYSGVNLEGAPLSTYVSERVYLSGMPAEAHEDLVAENLSSRHTFYYKPDADVTYVLKLNGNDGCRMFINGDKVASEWGRESWQCISLEYAFEKGKVYEFVIEHYNRVGTNGLELLFESKDFATEDEIQKLKSADCVVVCLGHDSVTEKENKDRTFTLPDGQVEFLRNVLEHNKNVVVVLNAGGSVEMASWMSDVKAVLMAWYPGQQGGIAVSEIITGKVNPSGRLPISIETMLEDNPCHDSYYENVPRMRPESVNPYSRNEYKEGIFVGYRGYDKSGVKPLYPFGYGLSYTTFEYSNMKILREDDEFLVVFDVKNTGKVAGAEVVQVYVTDDECSVIRPVKELKGFEKVWLRAGETKRVEVRLDEEAFRYYDIIKHCFMVESGDFTVSVGASAADIRLTGKLNLTVSD